MTDELDKLARALAKEEAPDGDVWESDVARIRIGLLTGMKLQRERDAVIAESHNALPANHEGTCADIIAQAIRTQP